METISKFRDKCVGCRSCEQKCPKQCITMKPNNEGFIYPNIDANICVQCGACIKACPVTNVKNYRNKPQQVWAFKNKRTAEIMRSASGGAADVACGAVLRQGGIVFGAAYDENLVVKHIGVTDETGRKKLQSSKYVQSDIQKCYIQARTALQHNQKVLFIGTPCQIAGLYSFLGGDQDNLFTIDLICHGVPSPKLFKKYLEYQSRTLKEKVLLYNFRSKDKRGWGTQYLIKTKTKTKTKILSLDKYGKHFMAGDCYRESCYQCSYANISRVADITVGDFWGIASCHPEFYSSKGVSSVFVNTDKGKELFELMKPCAEVLPVSLEDGLIKQGNLVKPTARTNARDTFYSDIDRDSFIDDISVGLQVKDRIKSLFPAWLTRYIKCFIK